MMRRFSAYGRERKNDKFRTRVTLLLYYYVVRAGCIYYLLHANNGTVLSCTPHALSCVVFEGNGVCVCVCVCARVLFLTMAKINFIPCDIKRFIQVYSQSIHHKIKIECNDSI